MPLFYYKTVYLVLALLFTILLPCTHWAPALPCAFRAVFCKPVISFPAGGRWPPLREGPICAVRFPAHRRGAHWAPDSPLHALPDFSADRPFCLRRAADGRPYEKAQSVRLAFLCRRRGAQWAPVLPTFRAVFRLPFSLLSPIFARNSC